MKTTIKNLVLTIPLVCLSLNAHSISFAALKAIGSSKLSKEGTEKLASVLPKDAKSSTLVHVVEKDGSVREITKLTTDSTGLKGEVNQFNIIQNGSVEEIIFNRPAATLIPSKTEVVPVTYYRDQYAWGMISPDPFKMNNRDVLPITVTTIKDTFPSAKGDIEVAKSFKVGDQSLFSLAGNKLRLQRTQFTNSSTFRLASTLTDFRDYQQIMYNMKILENGKWIDFRGKLEIPWEEGQILGYHFSTTGNRLTVQTHKGQEITYMLEPTSTFGDYELKLTKVSTKKISLDDFVARRVVIPGRATSTSPPKGIEIETSVANQAGAQ